MGKIIQTKINRWDGGITNQIRGDNLNYSRILKHFDFLTEKGKLIPYREMEDDGVGNTEKLCKFLTALDGSDTYQFGLGVVSGQDYAKIFQRTPPVSAWAASTTGEDSGGTRNEKVFIEYKGTIYGWARVDGTNARVWSYAIASNTFTSAARNTAAVNVASNVAQGLVHSKDDILYLAYNNIIAKNNAGSWTDAALTLPSNQVITSICEYGNFLAIACRSNVAGGKSVVYLWDRDSSLTTLSEKIDWGSEVLELIEEIDGYLVGVSTYSNTSGTLYGGTVFKSKVVFKYYTGRGTQQFLELPVGDIDSNIRIEDKQKLNNRLYFMLSTNINSVQYDAVWSLGKTENGFVLSIDRLLNNDTAITSCVPKGFQFLGSYMTVAYTASGSYVCNRTKNSDTFTATSTYETLIFTGEDSSVKKKLLGITVMTEALPAAGQIVLKYKKDEDTSWTRIFLHGTDNSISHSAINVEIGQDTITMTIASPAVVTLTNHDLIAGQKIRFRTTGALPTGVTAGTDYYVISAGLAADSFRFSATSGGTAINTSGTQSGTHTLERDDNLPEFKEIQFMIESTGNAVITGLKFKYELLDKDIY